MSLKALLSNIDKQLREADQTMQPVHAQQAFSQALESNWDDASKHLANLTPEMLARVRETADRMVVLVSALNAADKRAA